MSIKVTLTDVARAAGVSRATVDRVMNERGNVKTSTIERVNRALYSTNYLLAPENSTVVPFLNEYRFDFVLPEATEDPAFLNMLELELNSLTTHFNQLRCTVNFHPVEYENPKRFADALEEIGNNTHGIALAAPDHPMVRNAIKKLWEQGIGCVSLISDISGSTRLGYAGIDNRASGRTAGLLMGRFLCGHKKGKIALYTGSHFYSGHEEREAGFKSVIREQFTQYEIILMPEMHDSNELTRNSTLDLINQEPSLVGIYNEVGGGSVGICEAIQEANTNLIFIGHELNPVTQKYLLEGTIDVILDQGLKHQIYNAVEMLLHYKLKQDINAGILQPQFKIYLSENIV